jgi:predicted RNA-binding protein with PUA-like domain
MNYWLMKSEGDCYPIDQLKKDKTTSWSGVRNYQARNYIKEMKIGDMILFYHSSTKPIGVYGLARVIKEAHPDITAFDRRDDHYHEKSKPEKPIWECVDVEYVSTFEKPITMDEMKRYPELSTMKLFQKGSRLSVIPVTEKEYKFIVSL